MVVGGSRPRRVGSVLVACAACAAVAAPGCRVHYATGFVPPRPIVVAVEPPPPEPEEKPEPPFEGAVWIEGHHEWSAEGWVWLPGSYVRPRAGHRWVSPRYERVGGRVRYVPGYWEPVPADDAAAVAPAVVPPAGSGGPDAGGTLEVQGQAVDQGGAVTVQPLP